MSTGHKKRLTAFGLAEIIVALGIFGTAMIATIAIAVASLRTVKDNELSDVANSVMISSMEYLKSPAVVPTLLTLQGVGDEFALRVSTDIDTSTPFQEMELEQVTDAAAREPIEDCSDSSVYKVNIVDLEDFLVCNQAIIVRGDGRTFELRVIVLYQDSKGQQRSELIGFRNTVGGTT